MKKFFVLFLLVPFLFGCGPSINPALQKKIQELSVTKHSKSFEMKGKFKAIMPFSVGQWVMNCSTKDGVKSITKTSIVGKEGDAWIIENYSLTNKEEGIIQLCVKGFDMVGKSGSIDDIEFVWIKMKEDDKVEKIDGIALQFMKGSYKSVLQNMAIRAESMTDAGTVTVPAGTFAGVSKVLGEVSILGMTFSAESYYHGDVPVNGVIKTVSKDDDGVTELIDFGLTGAKPSF